jgi:hypothetical protein
VRQAATVPDLEAHIPNGEEATSAEVGWEAGRSQDQLNEDRLWKQRKQCKELGESGAEE